MKDVIKSQLHGLGVAKGDVIFIGADLMRVGYFNKSVEQTCRDWVDILIELVGDDGTLIIPAYTKSNWVWRSQNLPLFTLDTPPSAGALSDAIFASDKFKRSQHPTNSCLGFGKHSDYILKDHDESAGAYLPYHKVIELGGKNLMLGGLSDGHLCPMAIHAVQDKYNVLKRNWASGLLGCRYYDKTGRKRVFIRNDVGGCTAFGEKVLGKHFIKSAITVAKVGRSYSFLIDTKKSFTIFEDYVEDSRVTLRCENTGCPDCYGSPIFLNIFFWVKFLWRKFRSK